MSEKVDQEFVEYIVKSIVDNPEDVSTDRVLDEMGVLITLRVNNEDLGKVIGKKGQTINSIRTILRAVGMRSKARINLKLEEPDRPAREDSSASSEQAPEAPSETPAAE